MDGASENKQLHGKQFISLVSEAKDKNKIKKYKRSAESDIRLKGRYFIRLTINAVAQRDGVESC